MIVLNNRTLFFVISIIPIIAFGKSPETFIDNDALNKPCYMNSIKQEDLIVCFSKSYLLAQKRLNNNYLIAKKQKNINIKNYINVYYYQKEKLEERKYLSIYNV